jgi:hypothetical protein
LFFRHFEPSSTLSRMTPLVVIPALLSGPISYTVRSPYAALAIAFAANWSSLVYFTLAYRLSSFHPLAKFPGPLLAKTSKWWAAYISATAGDQHRCLKRLHDRYGDVVRIGWNPHPPFKISPLTRFRSQRALHSRCFLYPYGSRPGWTAQRPMYVYVMFYTGRLQLLTCDD